MVTTIFNLADDSEYSFADDVSPLYALTFCWCRENQKLSVLHAHLQAGTMSHLYQSLPFHYGKYTTALGDWCALNVVDEETPLDMRSFNFVGFD